jgi:NADH dehydrogenase
MGAKVAVGWIGDVDNLSTVMAGAHSVVHLVGGLDFRTEEEFREANLESTRAVVQAALNARIRRFIFLSYPGADANSGNPYLRYKGMAEEVVAGSGIGFVVLRATHVYGPGGRWLEAVRSQANRRPALVIGSGRQVVAPVFAEDVAAVVARVDDRDQVESGTWGLQGPDRVTADELADLLGAAGRRKVHVGPSAAALMARMTGQRAARATLEVLAADSLTDAPDAGAAFEVTLTPLRAGLQASIPTAQAVEWPE